MQRNPTVAESRAHRRKRIAEENSCSICPPRKGENARRFYRHGWNSKHKYKK